MDERAIAEQEQIMGEQNNVVEDLKRMFVGQEIEQRMLSRREIFLWGAIDDDSAKSVVQRILYFDGESKEDIALYINSPGGVISSGLAIFDAMQYAKSDIATICMGQAASMGAVVLASGAKGKRTAWENARVLIHQPLISGNVFGPASDIQIQAEEIMRIRGGLNAMLAEATGQPLKKVEEDTDRDYFLSAEEAKKYGIVDKVVKTR